MAGKVEGKRTQTDGSDSSVAVNIYIYAEGRDGLPPLEHAFAFRASPLSEHCVLSGLTGLQTSYEALC